MHTESEKVLKLQSMVYALRYRYRNHFLARLIKAKEKYCKTTKQYYK